MQVESRCLIRKLSIEGETVRRAKSERRGESISAGLPDLAGGVVCGAPGCGLGVAASATTLVCPILVSLASFFSRN